MNPMSKKTIVGVVIAVAMLAMLAGSIVSSDWENMNDSPEAIPFEPDEGGNLPTDSVNYVLFEDYGPLLLVLGVLMFGAIIGGVCISREEEDSDDSN